MICKPVIMSSKATSDQIHTKKMKSCVDVSSILPINLFFLLPHQILNYVMYYPPIFYTPKHLLSHLLAVLIFHGCVL